MIASICAVVLAASAADPSALWDAEGATLKRLTTVSSGENRAEALWRLGEWERQTATRLAQQDAKEDAIAPHLDAAEEAFSGALAIAHPDRVPQLLFSLGDLRRGRGRTKEAREPLEELVEKHASHPLAIDAAMALGDDAFEAGKLADAMKRYEFAREHASSNGPKAYAAYKLAWCRLNLEEYDKARSLFREVISLATASKGKALSLADEARRDLVVALARDAAVPAEKAKAEISQLVSGERARRYLGDYAKLIAGSGRDEEATSLLQSLEKGAQPAEAVDLLSLELEIATRRRDLPALLRSADRLADVVERGAPPTEAREAAERNLRVAAVTIHGEGRAAGDNARLETALALYEAYFRAFDGDPGAYELHHHAGELLVALHRPADAERHYTAAVERDIARLAKKETPGKWLDSSAHGAVEAAQDAMPPLVDDAPPSASQSEEDVVAETPSPTDLTAPESVFVKACERYLQALPQGSDAARIAYRRALVLYRHHRFDVAAAAFQSLLASAAPADVAPHAARLALDALRQLKKYDQVAQLAAKLKKDAALSNELGSELGGVQEAALLADAAREAAQGRPEVAAARYLAFADAFPHSQRLDRALYNGAAALTVQGRVAEAVAVRARLLSSMPKSPLVLKARERQFTELVMLGRFSEAGKIATVMAEEAKGPDASKWRHEAVVLAEASGDSGTADQLRRLAMEKAKGPEAFEQGRALAEHARGCEGSQEAWHKALAIAPDLAARTVALQRLARVEERCHLKELAEKHAGEAAWMVKKLGKEKAEALDASADAALLLASPVLEKYREVPLGEPYQKTIPKKLALLEAADRKLAAVIQRGRATAAACALVESGQAYAELARDLQKAKAPRGFTEDQKELFTEQLAEKAQPLVDRARESLEQAIAKAREAATRPSCLNGAVRALAELAPDRYGPRLEVALPLATLPEAPQVTAAEVLAKAPDAPAAWVLAAKAELAAGHPQAAIVLATRVEKDDPLAPEAQELVTLALQKVGPSDAALGALVRLDKEHPERPLAARMLADEALAMRDDDGAKVLLARLHERDPKDLPVAVDLALALKSTGDAAGAEKLLRDALKTKADLKEASLALGVLLCGDGAKPAEGAELLESFTKSGGRPADAAKFEATLAACRALAKGGAK